MLKSVVLAVSFAAALPVVVVANVDAKVGIVDGAVGIAWVLVDQIFG